jgi:inorganic phosphate transporter, PiT family
MAAEAGPWVAKRHGLKMNSDVVLVIVVASALAFDFTNGFHDTANAIATSVSTRAMSPRFAVALSAVLNFAGAFISLEVAATVGSGIVESSAVTTTVVFAGLIGAIAWNLATWYLGLPSSSSHALIGGLVGAAFVAKGADAVQGDGIVEKVIVPGLVAPVLAFTVAGIAILVAYRIVGRLRPGPVNRAYRLGQLVSGSMFSLAHGTNDAQKTMGIITLALIAHGDLSADNFDVPTWVIVSSAAAIALGTYTGGWRIIRTMGTRIIKMDPAQGFSAQGSGAAVVLAASHLGYPLSTTHTISGAVMGAGAAKRLSAVRWGVAGNIAIAWVLTLPAAAIIGGVVYAISSIFGTGALGPLVVSLSILGVVLAFMARRVARGQVLTAEP